MDYEALVKEHGSNRKAAKAIGVHEKTIRNRLKKQRTQTALTGLGLEEKQAGNAVIDNLDISGTSRYYKLEDGGIWIKTDRQKQNQAHIIEAALNAISKEIEPLPPTENNPICDKDLMALYVLSDFHLGMFAHKEEGGDDWSLEKGEKTMNAWIDKAVSLAPPAHTGVFLQNGDFLHSDGLEPVTPASKHNLDIDSRFQKIVDVAIDGSRRVISRMLEKHEHVHVIMADANHDPTSSVWLRAMFARLYEDEPRVTIDVTECPFYCFEWGNVSIFAHHGDKRNLKGVSKIFAGLYREVFGRTKYSYGHIGHFHHTAADEDALMHIQIHPTLSARDAYAARHGYIAQRKAKTIIYHKEHGEIGDMNVTPSML